MNGTVRSALVGLAAAAALLAGAACGNESRATLTPEPAETIPPQPVTSPTPQNEGPAPPIGG